jgi:hypothetical protein
VHDRIFSNVQCTWQSAGDGKQEEAKCCSLIHPKCIYFPEHFCYCFPSNLCVLNELTQTNAVFSRIAMVSHFCAEIQLSVKIRENIAKILFQKKTHEARRRDREGLGGRHTTRGRGPGLTAPTCCEVALAIASTPPSAYIYPLT